MSKLRLSVVFALLFATSLSLGAQSDTRRSRRTEERKADSLKRISRQLDRLSSRTDLAQEHRFLYGQVSALLARSRQAAAGSYLFFRLESAMERLLDASEQILEAGHERDRNESTQEVMRRAARDLERTYFRIQQGDYFAQQSQESSAPEYVLTARRLYQLARAAYDARDYGRARDLAEASREVITALESLAQAAVPIPEPPRLPGE